MTNTFTLTRNRLFSVGRTFRSARSNPSSNQILVHCSAWHILSALNNNTIQTLISSTNLWTRFLNRRKPSCPIQMPFEALSHFSSQLSPGIKNQESPRKCSSHRRRVGEGNTISRHDLATPRNRRLGYESK